MKIRKSVLLEALKVLRKVVAQTSPVEVVRSVRFVGDGERLRLVATDGVECVAVSVECEVAEAVDFAVEYMPPSITASSSWLISSFPNF